MYKNITLKVHLIYNLMYINIYLFMYILRYITLYDMYITYYFQCTLNVHLTYNCFGLYNVHCNVHYIAVHIYV